MKFNVWIEQTIVRATVVSVEALDADEAEEIAAHAAEDGRAWTHNDVVRQKMEVRHADEAECDGDCDCPDSGPPYDAATATGMYD